MDNAPPLNLSTSINVQDIKETNDNIKSHKDGDDYMFIQYGLNNLENVITITGEPVTENCKNTVADKETDVVIKLETPNVESSSINTLYYCSSCNKSFVRANQLRHHEKVHSATQGDCYLTDSKKFINTDGFNSPTSEHGTEDGGRDDDIKMGLVIQPSKDFRKFTDDDKKFKCSECEMSFLREVYLITHMRKHTGEKPFECEICKTRFKQMSHLTTHHRIHTQDRPYTCSLCNAAFSQKGSLRRHFRSHTGERPFRCDECGAVFVEKRNLSRHKLSHSGERPFKCDLCPSSFTQLIDLKRHKLSHFGIKPFKCELCGASFSRKNNLRWHKLTHEGKTPHKCEECNVGFHTYRDLKSHKRCHAEGKTYSCGKCQETFNQLHTFNLHMTIHDSSASPGDIFCNQQSLARHIKRHGNEKKFDCDKCSMAFTSFKLLRKHKMVFHCDDKTEKITRKEITVVDVGKIISEQLSDAKKVVDTSQKKDEPTKSPSSTPVHMPPKEVAETSLTEDIPSLFLNQSENSSTGEQPTLVLTQPGLPPKTGRPAGNCQNHNAHVQTMIEGVYDNWQVWCFCEPSEIISSTTGTPPATPSTSNCSNTPCSRVPPASTNVTSCCTNISTQSQILDDTSNHTYDSNVSNYPAGHDNIAAGMVPTADTIHEISANHITNAIPTITDPIHVIAKNEFSKSPSNCQDNITKENTTGTDLTTNITECNDLFYKNSSKEIHNYMEVDSSVISVDKPPSSTHCIKEDENGQVISFNAENKFPVLKHFLSNNLDDKMFINNEFASPFLSTDLSNKPDQSNLSCNSAALSKDSNRCYDNDEFQTFDNVFQQYNDPNDKNLPQQYCLTVNNPATGDIQIQSDLFSTKQNDASTPIKKRKLVVGFVSEPNHKQCPYCSKSFSRQTAYEHHLRTHTGEKPLMCGICRQCFSHKNSLIVHMRNHTGEKPYRCTHCSACFSQRSNLRVHNRTHTGERPFSCTLCDATFSQGGHLKAHERIHFNLRPFVCKTCNHAFTQKSALTRHEGNHSNKRNSKCASLNLKDASKKHAALAKPEVPFIDCDKDVKPEKVKTFNGQKDPSERKTEEVIDNVEISAEKMATDEIVKLKNSPTFQVEDATCKGKHRPTILQPTRRSRRLLESATKTRSKKDSDFITGDLDEIDRAEEIENQLIAVKSRSYRKKNNSAEEVQSWCFCEVAHGPNEPHTHTDKNSVINTSTDELSSQHRSTENPLQPNDTVYQLSIPNLSHAIVLQGSQDSGNPMPLNKDEIILHCNGTEHREMMSISSSSSQYTGSELSTGDPKLLGESIARETNRDLFESDTVINQVFSNGQLVTAEENTIYTLDSDVLNAETVVLNSSAGTIFFDVSSDGQMLALPMRDPIVVGCASDIQNAINLSGPSSDLHAIAPVSINMPIDNLRSQNTDGSITSQQTTETTTFSSSNIATSVDFVPLENNFIELFSHPSDNIDFDALKASVSPKGGKKKKITSVIIVPFKCVLCCREFAQKSGLNQHMKEEHADEEYCTQCSEVFATNVELLTHKAQQHAPVNLCNECNTTFDTKTQLNRHTTEVHKMAKARKDMANCEPCGAKFSQISDYKRHMQSHLGIKPFICNHCGAPFTRKSSLNKHERIHTGERPYTCIDCGKNFSYRYQFNRHRTAQCT